MRILSTSLLALLMATTACDSGKKEGPDKAQAKAAEDEAAEAKRIEERRKAREAKAAAKKKAEEDKKKAIDELCVIPEDVKKPKKLADACEATSEAQVAFFKRQYAGEPDKLASIESKAEMQKQNLMRMCTSMDIALGLKNAFDKAPEGMGPELNEIIATCMRKLGTAPKGGAAVPAKRPG
ncbi:MAG: hypothetical protein AAF799_41130 [Myxococcota bacterium]